MKLLQTILFFFCCCSCYVPRIKLSEQEKDFEEVLQREFNNPKIELRHDYNAITGNRKDGHFWVNLSSTLPDLCKRDSVKLKQISFSISKRLLPILTNKKHYNSIDFDFYTGVSEDPRSERQVCSKRIIVPVLNLSKARVDYYNENY